MKQGHKDILLFIAVLAIIVVGITAIVGASLPKGH